VKSKTEKDAIKHFTSKLHDMPGAYIKCRDMRHAWEVIRGYRATEALTDNARKPTHVSRQLECSRCGCVRTDVLNVRTFDKVATSYDYPESYVILGNKVGRGTANLVRREVYEREQS